MNNLFYLFDDAIVFVLVYKNIKIVVTNSTFIITFAWF